MQSYEDVFKRFFQNKEMPNPFDADNFREFIQNQIQSAIPDLDENMDIPNSGQANPGSQNTDSDYNFNKDNSGIQPGHKFTKNPVQRPNRKGTTSGMSGHSTPSNSHSHVLKYNAFETHDHVIVRIAVPNSMSDPPTRLLVNSHRLFINSDKSNQPMLQLHIPKLVDAKLAKIDLRNDILEVVLPKKNQEPLTEYRLANIIEATKNDQT